jgi:hypothetical protein
MGEPCDQLFPGGIISDSPSESGETASNLLVLAIFFLQPKNCETLGFDHDPQKQE